MAAAAAEHVLIWEFRVRAGREAEFEATYGTRGDWAALFRSSRGYLARSSCAIPRRRAAT